MLPNAANSTIPRLAWVATLTLGLGGCVTPDYHLPQGFSSTYYRHAQMHDAVTVPPETEEGWWSWPSWVRMGDGE